MSTLFPEQSDASAFNDLRAWSEEQLIAAAKSGRRAPFGELCERHMKKVSCVTRRIVRNREDAEDAAQECFLNAFVHLKDFDGRSSLSTWLTRIAINSALMILRKRRVSAEIAVEDSNGFGMDGLGCQIADRAPDPERRYALGEEERILKQAIRNKGISVGKNKERPENRERSTRGELSMSQNGNKNSNQPVGPFPADFSREEQIRRRAYELYVERGGQSGHEMDDWLRAERELEHIALYIHLQKSEEPGG